MNIMLRLVVLLMLITGSAFAATVPENIKKVVTFIYVENNKGEKIANGTAFFTGVPNAKVKDSHWVYLATARHVLADNTGNLFPHIFIRLPKRTGGIDYLKIPLVAAAPFKRTVFLHQDANVDLAVIPIAPDEKVYDYMFLPDELITTEKKFSELRISEGSEVFFAGLFTPFPGANANYPVFRFGRVALLTKEKIPWDKESLELYLVESSSFGGNSGSPVFFYLGADRNPGSLMVGNPEIYLAGVVKGSFGQKSPLTVIEHASILASQSNIGISAIVPAHLLHDLLHSKAVLSSRQ